MLVCGTVTEIAVGIMAAAEAAIMIGTATDPMAGRARLKMGLCTVIRDGSGMATPMQ